MTTTLIECTRVEAVIDAVMARYPGMTPAARARYYEAVHQELAPLARSLERENIQLRDLLVALLASEVGRQTLWKLGEGQSTDTDEGRAWLRAAELVKT